MLLGGDFKKKSMLLCEKYVPVELDYNISFEDKYKAMEEWYRKSLDLYYEFGLTKEKLKYSINDSKIIFRQNLKEFLNDMYKNDIQVIILSAGIGNVIEICKTPKVI